jgi:hypothetical protein
MMNQKKTRLGESFFNLWQLNQNCGVFDKCAAMLRWIVFFRRTIIQAPIWAVIAALSD